MSKENILGTLVVVVLKAQHLIDNHTFYKQDPYANLSLSGASKQTPPDPKGGQHPLWDAELRFPISKDASKNNRTLTISVFSEEKKDDELLGEGSVDITDTLKTGEFDDWVPLSLKGTQRGDVYLEMSFFVSGPAPLTQRPTKFTSPSERLGRPQRPAVTQRPPRVTSQLLSTPLTTQGQQVPRIYTRDVSGQRLSRGRQPRLPGAWPGPSAQRQQLPPDPEPKQEFVPSIICIAGPSHSGSTSPNAHLAQSPALYPRIQIDKKKKPPHPAHPKLPPDPEPKQEFVPSILCIAGPSHSGSTSPNAHLAQPHPAHPNTPPLPGSSPSQSRFSSSSPSPVAQPPHAPRVSSCYANADGAESDGGYSDADGAASDGGYSSDGNISSMYDAYSLFKSRKQRRWPPILPRPPGGHKSTRTKTRSVPYSSPPSTVYNLPNNVLIDIFTIYGANVFSEPGGHKYWWHTLAFVCRKWNSVIRSSPSLFLDELRFGNDDSTFFFKNISHHQRNSVTHSLERSPLLPLHIHYDLIRPSAQSFEYDEDDIVVLLQHLERVYFLRLHLSLSTWCSIAAATSDMPVSCTFIEHIHLHTGDRTTGLLLPDMFLKGHSPRLRTLTMIGVFPPSLPSLLHFPTRLTCLVLDGIPDSSHLPPKELVTHLSNMPQLQWLSIGFLSATRPRRSAGDLNSTPSLDRLTLPCLESFHFRGVCTYLESLVTNLDAAAVYELDFTVFHQLKYTIPHVSAFLRRTKRYGFDGIRITFFPDGLVICATPAISPSPKDVLCFRTLCTRLDFQVASAAQICRALGPNFGNMEDLFVKYSQDQFPTQSHGEVDPSLWRELLSQFRGMKTLWISSALISEITASLGCEALRFLEEFPILTWIFVEIHGDDVSTAAARSLSELLASIRSLGGPVIDVYRLFSDKWKTGRIPDGNVRGTGE